MTQLFCGNLSFDTTDEELAAHLSSLNISGVTNSAVTVKGGRSKGWALIDFDSPANAQAAVEQLHDTELTGRKLNVRESRSTPAPAPVASAPAPVDAAPCATLFVGNLPWSVDTDGLAALFTRFNPKSAEVQKRLSGRSKGFGTVSFGSVAEATTALNAMTGYELEGRVLAVRYDKDNGASASAPSARLFVGNLSWSVDDDALAGMFGDFNVKSANVKVVNGRSRGFGIVEMSSVEEAQRALTQRPEFEHDGRTVFLRFDRM